jgi:phage N-6-adenine-methyltransferase
VLDPLLSRAVHQKAGATVTLARFKAENHPQQVTVRGAREHVDERITPPEFFAPLQRRFAFTVDACALQRNAKLPRYWSPEQDGLAQDWAGERVWCNPPYSCIEPWVVKANESRAELVVMLLPANRTEQGWWQDHIEPRRDRPCGVRCEFLAGRLRFITPGAVRIGANERPPFGSCLLIWGADATRNPPAAKQGVLEPL